MIPSFPRFKSLEIEDKEEIEHLTKKYPPYSDFIFTSLWAWDTNDTTQIAKLNGNLVIRFQDYVENNTIYTFIGDKDVIETIDTIFLFLKESGQYQSLSLVPQHNLSTKDQHFLLSKYNI